MNLVEMQEKIRKFTKEKDINLNVETRLIDLMSELGELSKEVLIGSKYGQEIFKNSVDFELEMGDVLFSLICIANETNVDLEKNLTRVLNKYQERFSEKDNIGSK